MIITKERDDKSRRQEFPKLILEDENISQSEVTKTQEKTLSTREIVTFLVFCTSFMFIVYMQLQIPDGYDLNTAITQSLNANQQNFLLLNIEDDYWIWLQGLIKGFYNEQYYAGYEIPDNFKYSISNYNVLVTPLRITQRRMKLTTNSDDYTSAYVKDGWASFGFDYLDAYSEEDETTEAYGNNDQFVYEVQGSYGTKGGYVVPIDIRSYSQEEALEQIDTLKEQNFIDRQTRTIVVDIVLYNMFNNIFIMIHYVAVFEANGLITTSLNFSNLQKNYYKASLGYFRMCCEVLFCLLLLYYFIIETIEIVGDITAQKKNYEKEQRKKQARENRKKQMEVGSPGEDYNIDDVGMTPELGRHFSKDPPKKADESLQFSNLAALKEEKVKPQSKTKKACLNTLSFILKGLKEHYKDGWNWIDSTFLILSLFAVSYWAAILGKALPEITSKDITNNYQDISKNETFFEIYELLNAYKTICSINCILIFIKVLKYLASWFDRVMIIFKTLVWAQSDIFYFLIMYMIIFFAFVVMCHIYYGADLTDYGTIFDSLISLFLMLLGDLDLLDDMVVLNKVLTFFFFIAFMTSMQFILINMFIAFISNAYAEVNQTISSSKKLEDELKEKHWLVRIRESIKWLTKLTEKKKRQKEQEIKKNQKARQTLRKAMAKKINLMKNKTDGGSQTPDEQTKGYEQQKDDKTVLRKEKYLFGPGPAVADKNEVDIEKTQLQGSPKEEKTEQEKKVETALKLFLVKSAKITETERKPGSTTDNESNRSRTEGGNDDMIDELLGEDEATYAKSKAKIEEEKAKNILTRKEWDKNFDQNQFFSEETFLPALLSEKQDVQSQKEREFKCGRIMWASITFTLYAALYITLILYQLDVERNYWYNSALKEAIETVQDDKLYTLSDILSFQDIVDWLDTGLVNLAQEQNQTETNFTGFYIQDVNYVLGDIFRLCFQISKYAMINDTDMSHYEIVENGMKYNANFYGAQSNYLYIYDKDGYQELGGAHCTTVKFDKDEYDKFMSGLIDDQIITESTIILTVEIVTFEASQYVHTYSTIEFAFPIDGSIKYESYVFTMKLNQYKDQSDFVRLGFECLYLVFLAYNIVIFVKKLINKSGQYKRWKKIEIDSLSEIERNQRYQKRPEWLRKFDALFTSFTYFDLIYFSLALSSIAIWIVYIRIASKVDFSLPPSEDQVDYIKEFYYVKKILVTYTNIVAINTIFLSVKVFDYMNKSKHMKMLSNTLYSSREDTFYFLIIFCIFLFGFVGMAFISFGTQLEDYKSLGNAVRACFEITIGDFDYKSLSKTDKTMAVVFFIPFNILFVFILTNIFLAIINEAYENNQLSSEEIEGINLMQSIFYCLKPNEKMKGSRRKSGSSDNKSHQNDYLEVFEKLVVNLQISMSDLKAWAINCADEIKSELKTRTQLRHENREILFNKFKKMKSVEEGRSVGTGSTSQGKKYDEVECYKKRLQYWDYIRNGIQFISFQNKILNAVLKQKEREIQQKTEQFYKEKEKTQEIYKYLALLEKPVEERLEQIMNYRKVLALLEQEKNLLIHEEEKDDEGEDGDENQQTQNKNGNAGKASENDNMSEATTSNKKSMFNSQKS